MLPKYKKTDFNNRIRNWYQQTQDQTPPYIIWHKVIPTKKKAIFISKIYVKAQHEKNDIGKNLLKI